IRILQEKITPSEELVLQTCKSKSIRDFTVGFLASSAAVWTGTSNQETYTSTEVQLVPRILAKHATEVSCVKLVSKHFFPEQVFSDLNPDEPIFRWRLRNIYIDSTVSQGTNERIEDGGNRDKYDIDPNQSPGSHVGDMTAYPLDCVFGYPEDNSEMMQSDITGVPPRRRLPSVTWGYNFLDQQQCPYSAAFFTEYGGHTTKPLPQPLDSLSRAAAATVAATPPGRISRFGLLRISAPTTLSASCLVASLSAGILVAASCQWSDTVFSSTWYVICTDLLIEAGYYHQHISELSLFILSVGPGVGDDRRPRRSGDTTHQHRTHPCGSRLRRLDGGCITWFHRLVTGCLCGRL
ncbi:hypothetical protein BHE74_00008053, partial [Ensete ventricosum]